MDVSEAELINEFEYQYYGFSPAGFTDSVYNISIQSWEEAVKEVFCPVPYFEKVLNNKNYLADITGMIFHRKEIRRAFEDFTERVLKYILRIPRHVTLPEHEDTYQLLLSDDPSLLGVDELNRQSDQLANLIIEYRFILKDLNEQLQEANDAIKVLATLTKQLERLSSDVKDDSMYHSDQNTISTS